MGRVPAGDRRLSTPRAFAYHRAVAPMMWVFVALASIELVIVHLLVAMWSVTLAITLSLLTLASVAWLVGAIRAMARCPVLVEDDRVLMRVGRIRAVSVPRASIVRLRGEVTRDELKRRGVVNLALIAHPDVMLELDPPLAGRRGAIGAVAHRLDDPRGFAAALGPLPREP